MHYLRIMPSQQFGICDMSRSQKRLSRTDGVLFHGRAHRDCTWTQQHQLPHVSPMTPAAWGKKKPHTRAKVGSSNPTSPVRSHLKARRRKRFRVAPNPLPTLSPCHSPHPSPTQRKQKSLHQAGATRRQSRNTTPPRARLLWAAGGFSELVQPPAIDS